VSRGMLLLAMLFLLILAGIVTAVAWLRPTEPDLTPRRVAFTGGDPDRGRQALARYGCITCHTIPGISEARGLTGPPLDRFAHRTYVGGVVPNTPGNLIAWIMDPPAIDPRTAMPATGISEAEARDVAAYLYTLR
jgi:cytochrome c